MTNICSLARSLPLPYFIKGRRVIRNSTQTNPSTFTQPSNSVDPPSIAEDDPFRDTSADQTSRALRQGDGMRTKADPRIEKDAGALYIIANDSDTLPPDYIEATQKRNRVIKL
jgi:hypothetical protein